MMSNIGLQQCDSFDEDDIDDLQAELEHVQGPSLADFNIQEEQAIVTIASRDIIVSILEQQNRDLKLIGNNRNSAYQAFLYVLLLIGVQQRRNYPHLNTLIRQQFYKPNIFQSSDQSRAEMALAVQMLQKSLQYFEQIGEGVRLQQYITREPIFQEAGIIMLRNSVEDEDEREVYDQLANKFNIDMVALKKQVQSECYQFGANKRYHIIRQHDYYFAGTTHSRDDGTVHSRYDMESVRSGESAGMQFIPQVSENSTPKFKNSEARFHKKSHKNSFGGQFEIVQYRDLLQLQSQKLASKPKVLSEYMDMNQVQSEAQHHVDLNPKVNTFDDIIKTGIDGIGTKPQMKGSTTIEPTHHNFIERRRDRKISSSQIIQYRDFGKIQRHDTQPQVVDHSEQEQQQTAGNSYSSLVMKKEEPGKMKTSIITGRPLDRIEEMQSSQKESTHRDKESQKSQRSDYQNEVLAFHAQNESQVKLKDRKYSYFTQQMASSKSKKYKQIEGSNYVFKLPKNTHKNSEVITSQLPDKDYIKHRFDPNPLRFSQLDNPSEDSNIDHHPNPRKGTLYRQLRLNSQIYSHTVKIEPSNWYKKQVIYYCHNNQRQVHVYQRNQPLDAPRIAYRTPDYQSEVEKSYINAFRDSFGSSQSFITNLKSQPSMTTKDQGQPSVHRQAQEHNQNSFLKNRIQSMAHLDSTQQIEGRSEDARSTSNIAVSNRSVPSMRVNGFSPTKISFNYVSSPTAADPGTPSFRPRNLPYNFIPMQRNGELRDDSRASGRPQAPSSLLSAFQNRFSGRHLS